MSKNTPHLEKAKQIMDEKLDILFSSLEEENPELLTYLLQQIFKVNKGGNYCRSFFHQTIESIPGLEKHNEIVTSIGTLIYMIYGCYKIENLEHNSISINNIYTLEALNKHYIQSCSPYLNNNLFNETSLTGCNSLDHGDT